jgi:hypothetical protein
MAPGTWRLALSSAAARSTASTSCGSGVSVEPEGLRQPHVEVAAAAASSSAPGTSGSSCAYPSSAGADVGHDLASGADDVEAAGLDLRDADVRRHVAAHEGGVAQGERDPRGAGERHV